MIAFIARNAIRSSGKTTVATTVETGMLLDLAIQDLGGTVIRGKVGDVYAAHLARDNDAALGVESVGVYILPQAGYYPDSIFAALTLLGSITEISDIREFIGKLPPLHFSKDKVTCGNYLKLPVMQQLANTVQSLQPLSINRLDGLRLEFGDAWMLIRASGTEPAIRILAESKRRKAHSRSSRKRNHALYSRGIPIFGRVLRPLCSQAAMVTARQCSARFRHVHWTIWQRCAGSAPAEFQLPQARWLSALPNPFFHCCTSNEPNDVQAWLKMPSKAHSFNYLIQRVSR